MISTFERMVKAEKRKTLGFFVLGVVYFFLGFVMLLDVYFTPPEILLLAQNFVSVWLAFSFLFCMLGFMSLVVAMVRWGFAETFVDVMYEVRD